MGTKYVNSPHSSINKSCLYVIWRSGVTGGGRVTMVRLEAYYSDYVAPGSLPPTLHFLKVTVKYFGVLLGQIAGGNYTFSLPPW